MIGYRMNVSTADGSMVLGSLLYPLPDLVQQYANRVTLNGLYPSNFVSSIAPYLRLYSNCVWLCTKQDSYLNSYVQDGIVINYFLRIGAGSLLPGVTDQRTGIRFTFNNGSYIIWDSEYSDRAIDRLRYYDKNNNLILTATGNYYAQYCPFILPLPLMFNGELDAYGRGIWGGSKTGAGEVFSFGSTIVEKTGSLFFWYTDLEPVDVDDPYVNIPDSQPSGPAEGTGIPANDPVDIPSLPTASAIDTGFISLFNPTLTQVRDLADFMWTNTLFDVNNLKKIFANPMDCILGFNMVPVDVPSGGTASVTVGNIVSTVSMNVATSQWVEKDCGSINVNQWIGNYMDFAPDSKYSIYLPYIGVRELSTDDLVGKTVKLVYHVDVLSCSCLAFLKCGDSVLYEFAGQCGYSIPVTNNDFTQMIANICRLAVGIGGAAAGGGMSASGVGNMADAVMGLKPQVHRSGSVGGSTGLMGGQTPYLIMELPNICKPTKQYHYLGYPSFVTKKLGDLSGFASFESVILDGIGCTDEERNIILAMCREGIYL